MKKQILTLTMCLALTSAAALAAGTSTVAKTAPVKSSISTTKVASPVVKTPVKPEDATSPKPPSREEFKKQMEEKFAKERQALYDSLSLSDEQKAKAELLDTKTRNGVKPLMSKVRTEKTKLKKLEEQKACSCEILKQKYEVKKAHKAVKAYLVASRKEFEAILNKEQVAKFKVIDAERKAKMKEFKKHHKGHRSQGMGPKGPAADKIGPPPGGCPNGPKPPELDGPPPSPSVK